MSNENAISGAAEPRADHTIQALVAPYQDAVEAAYQAAFQLRDTSRHPGATVDDQIHSLRHTGLWLVEAQRALDKILVLQGRAPGMQVQTAEEGA